jgi:hypothetical protein
MSDVGAILTASLALYALVTGIFVVVGIPFTHSATTRSMEV